jgi:hypothetical protein
MLRVAAILLWFCSTIASAAITVKLDRLSAPGWQLHAIDALVAPVVEAPGAFALTVSIRSIRAADVTLNYLTLRCANARLSPAAVECADGRLSIDGVEHCVSAAIDRERADLALRLRCAPGTLNVQSSSQDVALTAVGVSLKSLIELLPPALLAPLDAADGVLNASFRGESVDQLAGDIRWRDGTLRSSALGLEAEGMALDCRVRDLGANWAMR